MTYMRMNHSMIDPQVSIRKKSCEAALAFLGTAMFPGAGHTRRLRDPSGGAQNWRSDSHEELEMFIQSRISIDPSNDQSLARHWDILRVGNERRKPHWRNSRSVVIIEGPSAGHVVLLQKWLA